MKNRIILYLIITSILSNSICISQTGNKSLNLFPVNPLKLSYKFQKQNYRYNWNLKDSSNTDIIGNTDDCDLFLISRSSLKDVSIKALRGSVLVVEKKGIKKEINVRDINKIKFPGASGFWTGSAIGFGISLAGWTILGLTFGGEEGAFQGFTIGLIYALPSGLVGGLIGLIFDTDDEVYDIAGGNPKAKLKRLKYIIDKHTPGKYLPD